MTLSELNKWASCSFERLVENIIFLDWSTCLFVFKGGHILYFDTRSLRHIWAAQTTKRTIGLPSALSHCGKKIVLSVPSMCQIRHLMGNERPPVDFLRAPPCLKDIQSIPAQDVFIAWDTNNDIVTWNGRTGAVLHYLNNQDFERSFLRVAATTYQPKNLSSNGAQVPLSIVIAAVTAAEIWPTKPYTEVKIWRTTRQMARTSAISCSLISSRILILKSQSAIDLARKKRAHALANTVRCRGFCRRAKPCDHASLRRTRRTPI